VEESLPSGALWHEAEIEEIEIEAEIEAGLADEPDEEVRGRV
jgi:hypothetical protein